MNSMPWLRAGVTAAAIGAAWPAMAAGPVAATGAAATLSGGIGVVALKADEIVYASSDSPELSHLIWQGVAPMLTAGLDVRLPDGWTFAVKAQAALGGDSYMEDYDWFGPYFVSYDFDDWTHRSQHDDTRLDWYFNGSVALGRDIAVTDELTLNVNGGLRYTDVQWAAYGGSYVYSWTGYRADVGNFADGEPAISYRQQFPAVFVGADAEFVHEQWIFGLGAQGGVTFNAVGDDTHWMRKPPLNFIDKLDMAPIVSLSASAEYKVDEQLSLFIAGTFDRVFVARADTEIYNNDTGVLLGIDPGAAGGGFMSASISAGFKGRF